MWPLLFSALRYSTYPIILAPKAVHQGSIAAPGRRITWATGTTTDQILKPSPASMVVQNQYLTLFGSQIDRTAWITDRNRCIQTMISKGKTFVQQEQRVEVVRLATPRYATKNFVC